MDSVRRSARMLVWIALTVALASLLVGCESPVSDGPKPNSGLKAKLLGLPLIDVTAALKVGIDRETLDGVKRTNDTVLAINETLKTGPEIGPETRALADRLIEQINKANENLKNGVGLNPQTLATLEHAITVLDKGIKVGLDDATLQTIDGVANVIDRQPEKWGEQSRALVDALRLTGRDLAKETADQVVRVIEQTQTSTQGIIAAGGEQFRCNADWLGNKASRSVGEAAGKVVAGFLHSLGKGQKPTTSPAGLCAILPDRLDLVYVDGKLVADKPSSIVTVSGFNFAADNKPRVTVRDEKDTVYLGIDLTSAVEHPYRMTVNLQGKDFSNVTFGAKLVLAWSDEISTTLRNEKAFFIEPLRAPVAKFEGSAISGTVPFAIQFTDWSEGLPEKWFWDFGNGKTSTEREPTTVVYDKPGKYTVQLLVSNRRGKDVKIVPEYVTVLVPRAPQVEFRADQRAGVAPLTASFQDQSNAAVGDIKDWKWDFGDGATSNERNPKHTYTKPGTYTVKLSVTDQYGTSNSASKTAYVSVTAPPTPTPTRVPTRTPTPTPRPIQIKVFEETSRSKEYYPEHKLTVPAGYKILGGGARANWEGAGSLLTASYPQFANGRWSWIANSAQHIEYDPSTITVWAIGLYDPDNQWDVKVFSGNVSDSVLIPQGVSSVPRGYVMVGGGAKVDPLTLNLLTASYPETATTWRAASRAHEIPSANTITAYAIGIKPETGSIYAAFPNVERKCSARSSNNPNSNHVTHTVGFGAEYMVLGGGGMSADGNWNYLTASYPSDAATWLVKSKDHRLPSVTVLTVCALGAKGLKLAR